MTKKLDGKLALVTGSSRGMGAAIAKRLAEDGASVIVTYAKNADAADDVVAAIREAGGRAEAVGGDLTSDQGIKAIITAVDGAFGGAFEHRLNILVNNAGIAEFGDFLDTDEGAYDRHFDLNVRAPIALSKAFAPRMIDAGWGRIVNIASVFGETARMGQVTLYIASKFALHGFTRALSRELGSKGVTVNGIQPGAIATDLAPPPGTPMYDANVAMTSLGRYGEPEEIAAAAAFLCSPEASYVNGENLTVDGGWNA